MNHKLPADFEIRRVDRSQERVVTNLLELYCHDMSQWFQIDANEFGLYDYDPEKVWTPHIDVLWLMRARYRLGLRWLIRVMQGNLPALPLWRRMVADYTKGACTEEDREVSGRTWSYFTFT